MDLKICFNVWQTIWNRNNSLYESFLHIFRSKWHINMKRYSFFIFSSLQFNIATLHILKSSQTPLLSQYIYFTLPKFWVAKKTIGPWNILVYLTAKNNLLRIKKCSRYWHKRHNIKSFNPQFQVLWHEVVLMQIDEIRLLKYKIENRNWDMKYNYCVFWTFRRNMSVLFTIYKTLSITNYIEVKFWYKLQRKT